MVMQRTADAAAKPSGAVRNPVTFQGPTSGVPADAPQRQPGRVAAFREQRAAEARALAQEGTVPNEDAQVNALVASLNANPGIRDRVLAALGAEPVEQERQSPTADTASTTVPASVPDEPAGDVGKRPAPSARRKSAPPT